MFVQKMTGTPFAAWLTGALATAILAYKIILEGYIDHKKRNAKEP